MGAEDRLAKLGITLPPAPTAAGLYAPCVEAGGLLFLAGQVPVAEGVPLAQGHVGAGVSETEAAQLARVCALNALAIARSHLGSLDRVERVVRVGVFVASAQGFTRQPQVANGASQLLLDVFGEAGRHARTAIGLAELPLGVPVEVEVTFAVRPPTEKKGKKGGKKKT